MTFHHHNSVNSVFIHGILTIKADSRVLFLCFFVFLALMGLNKRKKHQCLAAITFLSPLKKKKKKHQPKKKKTSAQGSHEPQGHCFNTSKQSNYQCYYLGSIVMELMLWQIVVSASFPIHAYSESCVSSDCLPSAHRTPSVFQHYVSIVTPLFLLQSISQRNSHALASYRNP